MTTNNTAADKLQEVFNTLLACQAFIMKMPFSGLEGVEIARRAIAQADVINGIIAEQEAAVPVAEVIWFDPSTLTMPEKAGKIIDGSMAFIESAEIGTKLYATPQPAPAAVQDSNGLLLRARIADLIHLIKYATIKTATAGDEQQIENSISDLRKMIAAAPTPEAKP